MSERDPYAFLSPAAASAGVGLRTPMERSHLEAGATISEHDGWRVAAYEQADAGAWACDQSHLGKLDVRGTTAELDVLTGGLGLGAARSDDEVWTMRLTPTHAYVLCPFSRVAAAARAYRCGGDRRHLRPGRRLPGRRAPPRRLQPLVGPRRARVALRPEPVHGGLCHARAHHRAEPGRGLRDARGVEMGEYFWEAILDAGETIGIARASVVVREPQEAPA